MAEVDSLTISIEGTSDVAAQNIERLSEALNRVRESASGGAGLGTVAKRLQEIVAATTGATSAGNKIQKLVGALNGLQSVQKASGLNSVANTLSKLNSLDVSGVSTEKMQTLASALGELNTVQKADGLNSTLNSLKKIPDIINSLDTTNLETFKTQMVEVADAVRPLSTEMEKVAQGFSAFPIRIQKIIQSNQGLAASNATTGQSFNGLGNILRSTQAKFGIYTLAFRRLASVMGGWVTESNAYVENLNLFTVTMGDAADEALRYAETVRDAVGIDPSDWIRNMGMFKQITSGFGVVNESADLMAKNLTQLGYDISSFYNISIEESMQKLQSAISGELEPVRRLGYAIDVATLQQVAYNHGITQSVNSMNQAQKSQLRYVALMEQSGNVLNDMARTVMTPANSIRILKQELTQLARAAGNLLIPALQKIIPVAQAIVEVVTEVVQAIANLFGFQLPKIDYSGLGNVSAGADEAADAIGGVSAAAKEFKRQLIGIDELTVLQMPDDTGRGGGGGGGLSSDDLGLDLPEYDFLKGLSTSANDLKQKIKDLVPYITAAGAGLAAWAIPVGLMKGLDYLKKIGANGFGFDIEFKTLGLAMFLADMNEFAKFFKDFQANGSTFYNVAGMLAEFAGMLGDAFILLGKLKTGGALKVVQGIGEIVAAISDIATSGIDWNNANNAIRGLTNIAIGIGLFTGNIKVAAWSVALQGFSSVITELGKNWEAIRQGDWSDVDKVTLITGGLEMLSVLALGLSKFAKIKETADAGKAVSNVTDVANATGQLDTVTTTSLNPKLSSLAKNLGLGVVIIGEVAAAAVLVVGAVAMLGWELEQVGKAWEPVIANGQNVAIGVALGVGTLALIGTVTELLGSAGTTLIVNLGLGIAVLAEVGIAAGLFLAEVWAIGKGLDEVGKAWEPVLNNGETIAEGIAIGTGLLAGIGVVTAALGAVSIAGAGALPIAIGIGTAVLVELGGATVLFIDSLTAVADELTNRLAPALIDLNAELPTLSQNMSDFTDFMGEFAGHVVEYSKDSMVSGLAATIDTVVGWFTKDPLEKLKSDVDKIYGQAQKLNESLTTAVPELDTVAVNVSTYYGDVSVIAGDIFAYSQDVTISQIGASVNTFTGYFSGNPLKTMSDSANKNYSSAKALNKKLALANPELETAYYSLSDYAYFLSLIQQTANGNDFSNISNAVFVDMQGVGSNLVYGFTSGINAAGGVGTPVITGLNSMIANISGYDWYSVGTAIGTGIVNGMYNIGNALTNWGMALLASVKDMFDIHSPSKLFRDQVGYYMGLGVSEGLAQSEDSILSTMGGISEDMQKSFGAMEPDYSVNVNRAMSFAYDGDADSGTFDFAAQMQERDEEVINALYAVCERLVRTINDKDNNVYMDGRMVSQNVTNAQDSRARMLGKSPAFV